MVRGRKGTEGKKGWGEKKIYGKLEKAVTRKRADHGNTKGILSYVENGSGPAWNILGLGPGEFTRTDAGADDQRNELAQDGGLTRVQGRDSEAGSRRHC